MSLFRGENLPSFEGYTCQLSRALFHLLNDRGSVCIEKEDDISVKYKDQILIVEQVKKIEGTLKYNSSNFINTLHNWLDLCLKIPNNVSNTEFILFLENHNDTDDYVTQCHAATTEQEAKKIVDIVIENINWSAKANQNRRSMFINHRDILYHIIRNFKINYPKNISSENDIDDLLIHEYSEYLGEKFFHFVDELKGMFYSRVIDSNKKLKKTIYEKSLFHTFLLAYGGAEKELSLPELDDEENKLKEELSQRYVKQLALIKCDKDTKRVAMISRVQWKLLQERECDSGISTEKNFRDMYKNMKDVWIENKNLIMEDSSIPYEMKGLKLYMKSISEDVVVDKVKFKDNKRVSRGVHNHMANFMDEFGIGWHPDYERLLNENE